MSRLGVGFVMVALALAGGGVARAETGQPTRAAAGSTDVRRLGDAFADVAEHVGPSVVQIDVTTGEKSGPLRWIHAESLQRGLGSGVIFTSDGAILTNNHVIEEARSIVVRLRDGRTFAGRLAGRDPSTDLAVLRIDAHGLPAAEFGDSDAARVGQWVVAIGSPFGLGHSVTTGVLSAKGRGGVGINLVEDYLQTDASINPGNSGGPLVNLDGKVLGINTMIVGRGQGIGFAVPASIARRVAGQILKSGRVERAYIGLGMQDLTPQIASELTNAPTSGALVNMVNANGPASKARLVPGDIIVGFAGRPVRDALDVIRGVFAHGAGETVSVEFVRAGKPGRADVQLDARHDPPPAPLPIERPAAPDTTLGLTVRDVTSENLSVAVVSAVSPDSAADRAGIKQGDVVLEVDGAQQPPSARVVDAAKRGHVLLRLARQGAVFYAALRR